MTEPVQNSSHVDEMVATLPQQSKEDEVMVAFTKAAGNQIQQVENGFFQLFLGVLLDGAVGVVLDDVYGELLNEPRDGLDDVEYRNVLRVKVAVIHSQGTAPELIAITASFTGGSVLYHEAYPLTAVVDYVVSSALSTGAKARLLKFLGLAKPASVRIHATEGLTGFFGFAEEFGALGFTRGRIGEGLA